MRPLPTLVVSGFLGAGKTTLINELLAQKPGDERVGVIVNDFGRINVDGCLLQHGADRLIELSGGCICCSLQTDLARAVRTLADRPDLHRLIIEASGISGLGALLHALADPSIAGKTRVVQAAALVDVRRYLPVLHTLPVIADQVRHARMFLLTHADQVSAPLREATIEHLNRRRPDAPVILTRQGRAAWGQLWAETSSFGERTPPDHHHEHWLAYEITLPVRLEPSRVLEALNQLPDAVERVKGFWSDANERLLFQKVGPHAATLERGVRPTPAAATNALVVLARAPIDDELQRSFARWAAVRRTTA